MYELAQIVGWIGSLLILLSMALNNQMAFRSVNTIGQLLCCFASTALGIHYVAFVNVAIIGINAYKINQCK